MLSSATPSQSWAGEGARVRRLERRCWWAFFVTLFLVIGTWSLASPLFSYPDEAAHVVKAEAVVRGQLLGRDVGYRSRGVTHTDYLVKVPGVLENVVIGAFCFDFFPDQPANCQRAPAGPAGSVEVKTYVGAYPPLYYLMVGWPSLASPGTTGIYLMRLVSGALNAAFLASALVSVLGLTRRRLAALGLLLAVTPVTLYMAGAVNPAGLEITSAVSLWAAALALALGGPQRYRRRLVVRAALASCVFVSMRGLSPLLFLLVAISVLAVTERAWLRELARRASVRTAAVLVGVVALLAVSWDLAVGAFQVLGVAAPSSASNLHLLSRAAGDTWYWARGAVAMFGYLNVNPPAFVIGLWMALAAGVLVLGLVLGPPRIRRVLVGLLAVVIVLPIVLTFAEDRNYGPVWEGRYVIPLAAGLTVLAGLAACGRARSGLVGRIDRFAWIGFAGLAVATVTCFLATTRRFMVGANGPLWFVHGPWQPPLPVLALAGVFLAAELALVAELTAVTRARSAALADGTGPPRRRPAGGPGPEQHAALR